MPTKINNSASVNYGYGGSNTDSATSNSSIVALLEKYSVESTKGVQNKTFRPGEILSFYIHVKNTGTDSLYNVTVTGDLGGESRPLRYLLGSAYLNFNGVIRQIEPTTVEPLSFLLPEALNSGVTATICYLAKVSSSLNDSVQELTNKSIICANAGSESGKLIDEQTASIAVVREEYAFLKITKHIANEYIQEGVPFSYVINLENSGNLPANNVVVTDNLPAGFSINSIVVETERAKTILNPTDYAINKSTNMMSLPSNPNVQLNVPRSIDGRVGRTTITITGQINS